MATRAEIDEFLAQPRLGFVGVSRDPKAFSASVYRELRDHGHDLVPVNPGADVIEGDACCRRVADLPADIDSVLVMVPADRAADVVRDCVDRGVRRVWLHRGVGPSSVSVEAVELCAAAGVTCIDGACPLMFVEPTGLVHRIHRTGRRLTGRLPV